MPRVFNLRSQFHHIPDDAIYIGRGSKWGNPYVIGEHGSRKDVLRKFAKHVLPRLDLAPLVGKSLVCWCSPQMCHGDLILRALAGKK